MLLVEDDPGDRAAAAALLKRSARVLHQTVGVGAALDQLSRPLDLIVTDLSLSGRIAGCRRVGTALTRWPASRAIVVSGNRPPQINPLAVSFTGRILGVRKPPTAEGLAEALGRSDQPLHQDTDRARTYP